VPEIRLDTSNSKVVVTFTWGWFCRHSCSTRAYTKSSRRQVRAGSVDHWPGVGHHIHTCKTYGRYAYGCQPRTWLCDQGVLCERHVVSLPNNNAPFFPCIPVHKGDCGSEDQRPPACNVNGYIISFLHRTKIN
jgi:hypothetical protein